MSAESLLFGQNRKPSAPPAEAAEIRDTTTQTFRADVLEASRTTPVLVDFWAPWCGPCRQLTPVLEKAVRAAKGKVRLVKMNIDEHPQIAGQLGIQSIPAVIAFKNGQPLDGFMGAVPESQVTAFIERVAGPLGPSEGDGVMEAAAAALAAKDYSTAAGLYSSALQMDGNNLAALAGLVRCFVSLGELEQARGLLAGLTPEQEKDAAISGARAALELAAQAEKLGQPSDLEARLARDPNDHQVRFDLAVALNSRGDRAGATEQLLEIVRRDRAWSDEAARKQLLQFFEAWGPKDPAAAKGRQRLSALLFS
ncbi:MAG TPA: thioredoxin [Propylenella sp.]